MAGKPYLTATATDLRTGDTSELSSAVGQAPRLASAGARPSIGDGAETLSGGSTRSRPRSCRSHSLEGTPFRALDGEPGPIGTSRPGEELTPRLRDTQVISRAGRAETPAAHGSDAAPGATGTRPYQFKGRGTTKRGARGEGRDLGLITEAPTGVLESLGGVVAEGPS